MTAGPDPVNQIATVYVGGVFLAALLEANGADTMLFVKILVLSCLFLLLFSVILAWFDD